MKLDDAPWKRENQVEPDSRKTVTITGSSPALPEDPYLNVGDSVEYGVTHEIELPDRTKMWIKVTSSTTRRRNETSEQATDRLVDYVHIQLTNRIKQAYGHSSTITLA